MYILMYLRDCATKFRLKLNLYCISLQIKHPVSALRWWLLGLLGKMSNFQNFPGKDLGVSFTPGRQRNPPGIWKSSKVYWQIYCTELIVYSYTWSCTCTSCTFSILQFFYVALFHVALFSYCTFFMLHFFNVEKYWKWTGHRKHNQKATLHSAPWTCFTVIWLSYSTFYP